MRSWPREARECEAALARRQAAVLGLAPAKPVVAKVESVI
jgi:hypothetical protein